MVTLDKFRNYLRNPPDDDSEIEMFLNAAQQAATDAGVPEFTDNAKYDLFIYALAAMYYDHRGMAFSGAYQATAESNARRMINAFVLELRYANGTVKADE